MALLVRGSKKVFGILKAFFIFLGSTNKEFPAAWQRGFGRKVGARGGKCSPRRSSTMAPHGSAQAGAPSASARELCTCRLDTRPRVLGRERHTALGVRFLASEGGEGGEEWEVGASEEGEVGEA